ncbi:hypothetical protein H0H81_002607 [Sphagnurus paluster]|uniref:Uncharacterized protein n=1 Tax=Sphagnurus paluster TaxID=117069 RepID=A0A9P7KL79_9AGAR|nr:hypothetical protein H0H81_002607 [Sphagnurus paluster]
MAASIQNLSLCVPRASSGLDPNQAILASSEKPSTLPQNHVLIKVDRFGFSANNITYQALGEHPHFRYFDFNAAPASGNISPTTHGLFPVWGFGTIETSTHPKISNGERVYGYFAPTRYLLLPVSPADVNKHAFYIPRPHLPADRRPYNQILRCAADPHYSPDPVIEDMTMLYRPLFWTSYWAEDWLFASNYRGGASTILISSASAKTAFCLAYLVKQRIARGEISRHTRVVGLTSKGNVKFTRGLGHYDEVLEYDTFTSGHAFRGNATERWIYVDVASNEKLNARIFAHFASPYTPRLAACIVLGLTNLSPAQSSSSGALSVDWAQNNFDAPPSSSATENADRFWPAFEHFFMPEWLDVRKHQLSIAEIFRRQDEAWAALMRDGKDWVAMERVYGGENVCRAYEEVAKHGLGPERGLIWSLWDKDEGKGWKGWLSSKL